MLTLWLTLHSSPTILLTDWKKLVFDQTRSFVCGVLDKLLLEKMAS